MDKSEYNDFLKYKAKVLKNKEEQKEHVKKDAIIGHFKMFVNSAIHALLHRLDYLMTCSADGYDFKIKQHRNKIVPEEHKHFEDFTKREFIIEMKRTAQLIRWYEEIRRMPNVDKGIGCRWKNRETINACNVLVSKLYKIMGEGYCSDEDFEYFIEYVTLIEQLKVIDDDIDCTDNLY